MKKLQKDIFGFVEELPGANTQGATLDEARANLIEAVELVLEANKFPAEEEIRRCKIIREAFQHTVFA
ncbi:MAG: type II toxin-antitoxin system HicB family antitoxin [Sulfuricellaceae bacterium]